MRLNEHLEHPEGAVVFRHACKMNWRGSSRSALDRVTGPAGRRLAQVQEPGSASRQPRGGGGLGSVSGINRGVSPFFAQGFSHW